MAKLFLGQDKLRIQLTAGVDVTGSTCKIQYRKPDGTTGEWDGVIGTAATGVIYYDVDSTAILDQTGTWRIWLKVTFSDTKIGYGEGVDMVVYAPGN